jgi:hypothetical protein
MDPDDCHRYMGTTTGPYDCHRYRYMDPYDHLQDLYE